MRDISKRFPGVLALDNVSLSIERGEVHALLGENGAGKSTLMKILSGAYKKDAGEIIFDGQPVQINSPRQAQELGVSIIYQELNLVPQLSVAENIFLSSLPMKNPACIDWKHVYSDAQTIIDSLEVDINVRSRISSLGIAQQQMVEIAKALNHQAKVIVMDEPSAPLTDKETAKLFKTIAKLKSEGVAVIYISHRLEETMQIADRATIMRDGKTITTVNVSDITIDDLIRGMVGHDLKEQFPKRDCPIGEVGFRVEGISREGILNNISFEARKGEVVGICGLVGAGRTETARAIFGIDPKVALLSFSTKGSGKGGTVALSHDATVIAKELAPELKLDGEMQFDAAVSPVVGQLKFPGSPVAGHANTFIFPCIEAGNIGYKIAQRLGGFEAYGPILQGLNAPINDLSRGCNADEVYKMAIITAGMA